MANSVIVGSPAGMSPETRSLLGDLPRHWGWVMALGILFIVLGTVGLGMSIALTVTTVMVFGMLMITGGVFQAVEVFKCKGWKGVMLHIITALFYIAAGIMLVMNPLVGSVVLTAMLGGALIAVGVLRITMGFQLKDIAHHWGWIVFAGVMSLILGGMILLQWPTSALWVIGLLVAIELIMHGWSYVMLALAARTAKMAKQ